MVDLPQRSDHGESEHQGIGKGPSVFNLGTSQSQRVAKALDTDRIFIISFLYHHNYIRLVGHHAFLCFSLELPGKTIYNWIEGNEVKRHSSWTGKVIGSAFDNDILHLGLSVL